MKKFLCLFSALALTIVSCSKDDDNSNNVGSVLPKTIQLTNPEYPSENKTSTIIYDGNKIASISSQSGKSDFTYNGNHIINKVDYYMSGNQAVKYAETSYTYVNGKLETVNGSINGQVFREVYTHNSDGTVKKESYSTNKNTGVESKTSEDKMLTFVNGNLTKIATTSNNNSINRTVYDYDSKKNVFRNIFGISLLLDQEIFSSVGQPINSSVNNIEKNTQSVVQNFQTIYGPIVYTNECEYNTNGFPTKKTSYNEDGTVKEIFNYTY